MKRLSYYAMIGLLTAPMLASAAVGVSINVGQPGFYGQINLGDAPPPQLIYAQPQWVQQGPVYVDPIYLRVRPEHARHWRNYCSFYNACRRPVYFVRDSWYDRVYVPYHREHYVYRDDRREWQHRDHREHRDWDNNRGNDHDGNRGNDHGDRGNNGNGHGNNHGNGGHGNDQGGGHGREH